MADSKITALTALTAADPVNDMFPVVDVSDTTMAASGTTKKISVNNILGASGTATLASATITGAATVGTTLGVTGASTLASATITGLATVGTTFAVGTVTPDVFARFYTRSIGFSSSGSTVLQINGTSYGGVDLGAAGVRTFSMTSSATDANISTATNIPINFNINGATKMTLNTAGNLAFVTGKGIDFSATADGSGTMTSELLNDYEEGTFTPTIVGNTTAGVGVYVNQVGTYTKIGNQVTVWVNIEWSSHTGTGTQMYIGGLPFNVRVLAGYVASATIGSIVNISLTAGNFPLIIAGNSDNYARFFQSPTGGGAVTAVPMDTAGQVIFSMTYNT